LIKKVQYLPTTPTHLLNADIHVAEHDQRITVLDMEVQKLGFDVPIDGKRVVDSLGSWQRGMEGL
jgi:methylmalonyl-CoA mutase cobalamin-binding subunit